MHTLINKCAHVYIHALQVGIQKAKAHPIEPFGFESMKNLNENEPRLQ